MKLNENLVYCIVCQQLVLKAKSQWIFKTGFYMQEYALAQCNDCAVGVRQTQE